MSQKQELRNLLSVPSPSRTADVLKQELGIDYSPFVHNANGWVIIISIRKWMDHYEVFDMQTDRMVGP